ncbi:MAG TPA: SurA N-terminal domain-containing protein [Oligoflexia bacterium]|nr:SurA N-terminal domain-containing protein [Oligoflexia bacterium]
MLFLILGVVLISFRQSAYADELLDVVMADVNGKPITWSEVSQKMPVNRGSGGVAAKVNPRDQEARLALEAVIFERLVEAEARERKLGVSDSEVGEYLKEVARQNGLTDSELEKRLKAEGKSLQEYRKFVRGEILKSKLVAHLGQSMPLVEDDSERRNASSGKNIERQIENKSNLVHAFKLTKISLPSGVSSPEEALERRRKILENQLQLDNVNGDFEFDGESYGYDNVGVVKLSDLSIDLQNAVKNLEAGDLSAPVRLLDGWSVFKVMPVDQRESSSAFALNEHAEAENIISRKRDDAYVANFFEKDIYKRHSIDRKNF